MLRLSSILLLLLFGTAALPAVASSPEVPPGGVVRWPGDGTVTACQMDGRRWTPIDGDCWFPVDLLQPAGALELGRVRGERMETAPVRVAEYPYPVQHITLEDTSRVDLSPEDEARAAREAERIEQLWSLDTPRRFTLPLGPPLDPLPGGGRFGSRRFFNNQPRSPHSGADYSAASGTPVRAVADGRVALTGDFFFTGNSVFIDHGDGLVSMAFHLSAIDVTDGEEVSRGQVVGKVGATGRATGPHLHFGLRWRGARVDPGLLLEPERATVAIPAP